MRPGRLQRGEDRDHLGVGVERPVGVEKILPHGLWGGRGLGDRVVEGVRRQRPEVAIMAGEGARPGILELLLSPERRQAVGVRSDARRVTADGGMDVEERAVGVEDVDRVHGVSLSTATVLHQGVRQRHAREAMTSEGWA